MSNISFNYFILSLFEISNRVKSGRAILFAKIKAYFLKRNFFKNFWYLEKFQRFFLKCCAIKLIKITSYCKNILHPDLQFGYKNMHRNLMQYLCCDISSPNRELLIFDHNCFVIHICAIVCKSVQIGRMYIIARTFWVTTALWYKLVQWCTKIWKLYRNVHNWIILPKLCYFVPERKNLSTFFYRLI